MVYGYAIITDCSKRDAVEKELLDAGAEAARTDIYLKRNALPYRDGIIAILKKDDVFLGMNLQSVASGAGDLVDLIEALDKRGVKLKIVDEVGQFPVSEENARFYLSALVDFIRGNAKKRGRAISNAKNKN